VLHIGGVGGPASLSVTRAPLTDSQLSCLEGGNELSCHDGCSCHLLYFGASGSVYSSDYRSGAVHGSVITT
jgi:hypothetical protein